MEVVDGTAEVSVGEGTVPGCPGEEVDVAVFLGCDGPPDTAVDVEVAVYVDVGVAEGVYEAVGENAGLLVCVAVGVEVAVLTLVGVAVEVPVGEAVAVAVFSGVGVRVGTALGLLVLVGLFVGLARTISADVEDKDPACTGMASTDRKTMVAMNRTEMLNFIMRFYRDDPVVGFTKHRQDAKRAYWLTNLLHCNEIDLLTGPRNR